MSLSGNLSELAIADVIQLLYLGRRSGRLMVHYGADRCELLFRAGRIARAQGPYTHRLGELLLAAGAIDVEQLTQALAQQRSTKPWRSLGCILVAAGALSTVTLAGHLAGQMEETVVELLSWPRGRFEFVDAEDELSVPAPDDGIDIDPRRLLVAERRLRRLG
jgi:hypothetical protein